MQSWPTPQARDWEGQSQRGAYENGAKDCLPNAVQSRGQLNADWVELLMGFPLHWTSMEEDAGPMRDDPWGEGWEDGVPRVIVGQKDRVNRLRCLGNAVLPQCAYFVGRMILDMESGRADGEED